MGGVNIAWLVTEPVADATEEEHPPVWSRALTFGIGKDVETVGGRQSGFGASLERKRPQDKRLAAGVNLNDIGLLDPTRPDKSPWVDAISGASVRNGLPARMKRA